MGRIVRWLVSLALVLDASVVGAEGHTIPDVRDLRAEAAQVQEHRVPLMIMFYADYCGFCVRMEDEFLKPMLIGGGYKDKVLIRKVALDAGFVLKDFDGSRVTGADLAARYNVFVTPTLLFLDARGNQVAEKLVGLTTPDYFGGYLDANIDSALVRLRGPQGSGTAVAGRIDENCNPMC